MLCSFGIAALERAVSFRHDSGGRDPPGGAATRPLRGSYADPDEPRPIRTYPGRPQLRSHAGPWIQFYCPFRTMGTVR